MKKLLFLVLISFSIPYSFSQLLEEEYLWDNSLISITESQDAVIFQVKDQKTKTKEDDYLVETRFNSLGVIWYRNTYKIYSITSANGIVKYEVGNEDGNITVLILVKEEPFNLMIMKEFQDTFIIYMGNVEYLP